MSKEGDASGESDGACTGVLEDFARCSKQWESSLLQVVWSQRDIFKLEDKMEDNLDLTEEAIIKAKGDKGWCVLRLRGDCSLRVYLIQA